MRFPGKLRLDPFKTLSLLRIRIPKSKPISSLVKDCQPNIKKTIKLHGKMVAKVTKKPLNQKKKNVTLAQANESQHYFTSGRRGNRFSKHKKI